MGYIQTSASVRHKIKIVIICDFIIDYSKTFTVNMSQEFRSQESFIRSQCLYIGTLIRVNNLYIYIYFLSYISDIGGSCKDNIIVLMNLVISKPKLVHF